jgi:hypothetical protein
MTRRIWKAINQLLKYLVTRNAVPSALLLEFTNSCTANCIFCAYQYDNRKKSILPLEVIKKVADEYSNAGGTEINLTPLVGEIFADKDALEKIWCLHEKGFTKIETFTNATLFHKVGVEKILSSGLTTISISVPPLDKDLYARIYRSNHYPDVIRNIRDMVVAFSSNQEKTIKEIFLGFRSDRSLNECVLLPDYQEHVAPFLCKEVHVSAFQKFDTWGGTISQQNLIEGMCIAPPGHSGSKRLPCSRIFNIQILAGGQIRLCGCRINLFDKKDEMEIGNVKDTSIGEAFNSRKARKLITSFSRGKMTGLCKRCCWYYYGL